MFQCSYCLAVKLVLKNRLTASVFYYVVHTVRVPGQFKKGFIYGLSSRIEFHTLISCLGSFFICPFLSNFLHRGKQK